MLIGKISCLTCDFLLRSHVAEGVAGALGLETMGGNEVVKEGEGATFGDEEMGFKLMAAEGDMGGEIVGEEAVNFFVCGQAAARLQDVFEAGMTVDGSQQLFVGTEFHAADLHVLRAEVAAGPRDIALDTGRKGAEAINMHGTAGGQHLGQRIGHIEEESETGALAVEGSVTMHGVRELVSFHRFQVNGAEVPRRGLSILARRVLVDVVFDRHKV